MHFISIEIGAVNRVSIFYFCINLCLRLAMNYQYYASLNLIVKWKKVNERRCDHPTMMMLAVNVIQYNWPMKWIHVRMQMINMFYRIPASIHFLLSNVKVKSKKWKKQKQYCHSNKWRSLKHFFFSFRMQATIITLALFTVIEQFFFPIESSTFILLFFDFIIDKRLKFLIPIETVTIHEIQILNSKINIFFTLFSEMDFFTVEI